MAAIASSNEISPLSSSDLNSSAMAILGLGIRHPMILAAEEKQGPVVARDAVKHFAHNDGMVAAFVNLDDLAFEMADGAV